MPRYIDAEKLKRDAFEVHTKEYGRIDVVGVDAIDSAETADVAEVKRGEWKDSYISGHTPADGTVCGACDCWAPRRTNYCPNCGADMRKEIRI
jgi:hypothetical protein